MSLFVSHLLFILLMLVSLCSCLRLILTFIICKLLFLNVIKKKMHGAAILDNGGVASNKSVVTVEANLVHG